MELEDIQVGEEYARMRGRFLAPQRVRAVEVGVHRQIHSRWGHRKLSTKPDGVVVKHVDAAGNDAGRMEVVVASQLAHTWAAEQDLVEQVRRRRQTAKALRQVEQERAAAACRALGLPEKRLWKGTLSFTLDELEAAVIGDGGKTLSREEDAPQEEADNEGEDSPYRDW